MMSNNLKLLRESQGITVRDLSDRSNVPQGFIKQMESDDGAVSLKEAYAISAVLGLNVYDIWPFNLAVEVKHVTIRQVIKE